jgi:hypothetical protein
LDGPYTHTADHFTQSPDTPHTDGCHRLDDDRLHHQCYSIQLVSVSAYNEKDGSDDKHGVSSTDRLGHVLSTKLTQYLTSTRSVSLSNQPTLVDLPKDTVENRHPGWIESPSPCFRVDVLTVGNVSDEPLVGQNRARYLVLETCDTYELTTKADRNGAVKTLTIGTGGESSNRAEKKDSTECPYSFHQRQSVEFRFQLVFAELGRLEVLLMMPIVVGDVLLILEEDFGVLGVSVVLLNQHVWLAHGETVFEIDE